MELSTIYPASCTSVGEGMTPYDGNFQPFITPLTYIAITTENVRLLSLLGVGT